MGWLIALGVLTLLAVLPIGLTALYDARGFFVDLLIGPVRIGLLPGKPKKDKKKKSDSSSESDAPPQEKPKEKKGGSILDFWPLVEPGYEFLKKFFRFVRVKILEIDLTLAGSDPCDLAINYGKTWASVCGAISVLEQLLVIRKKRVNIVCNFVSEETLIRANIHLTMGFGILLVLVVRYGAVMLWRYIEVKNKRKEGANYESEST